jgi:hypothetical protein
MFTRLTKLVSKMSGGGLTSAYSMDGKRTELYKGRMKDKLVTNFLPLTSLQL